ncbi:putative Ribonuclease P protein subunit p20 [Hypsibius exemplaris]|uniref:Ribonuclease P protein subunit p20 n=1 Tax=Hypsibius exemplaris TaxID=2072580 RepID=A0A1W0X0W9_HYPEX|nr:putative Ribonuclease P protein subunit p20 [Hypsibius exemplaris]
MSASPGPGTTEQRRPNNSSNRNHHANKRGNSRGNPYTGPGAAPRTSHPSNPDTAARRTSKLAYDPAEYQLISHLPRRFPKGPGDVYLTLKTPFRAQMQKCKKLLEASGCREVTLHGMGAAVNRAVNLALQLQSDFGGDLLELSPTTGSVEMTDELEPLRDDLDPISQSRFVSVIKIKISFTRTLEDVAAPKAAQKT